ncbi:MAG: hypothetical protein PHD51_03085 [Patescibacteria group bacterium]|nr:hypothetical protein [Patescibacteria group bacterium]MDD5491033.1 hypothetical protein [Patescibacteria group bacterium]
MVEEEIKEGDLLIAKIIRDQGWPDNLQFYSNDSDFLQVATWNYGAGKHLKAHAHKICERTSDRTNEVLFIKQGKIKGIFYGENDKLISEKELSAGDIVIIYAGGHAYDILEDKTQVLEIKNGPYPGLELDKKIIER